MSTIRAAAEQKVWTIKGKLVHKQIFITKSRLKILKLILVDEAGDTVQLLSFTERKAYTLYSKVFENQVYIVTNSNMQPQNQKPLREPNEKSRPYSTELYETTHFYIDLDQDPDMKKGFIKCRTNFQDIKEGVKRGPQNILARFVRCKLGPPAVIKPWCPYQGYFVTLEDHSGHQYRILVWHSRFVERTKFPLFHCQPGDLILTTAVRSSWSRENTELFTFTTLRPVVLNSECVNPRDKSKFNGRPNSASLI